MLTNDGYSILFRPDNTEDEGLNDYKFFCFGGEVKCYKVDFDRFVEHHANYYDVNNNLLDFGEKEFPPIEEKNIILPNNVSEMRLLAECLSRELPFLRVDFYDINGKIYFGELTLYPSSGFGEFTYESDDKLLGAWLKLRRN